MISADRAVTSRSEVQPSTSPVANNPVDVSIILAVYNEERHIRRVLESLLVQEGCSFEILVADDGSTDATPAIVAALAATDSRIRVFRQRHIGVSTARNMVAKEARAPILVICDGDMTYEPTYLSALIAPILRGDAVGTFSRDEYVLNIENVWARCWNINDGLLTNKRHPDDMPDEDPTYRAIRQDVFMAVGGYPESGSGSDMILAEKVGALAKAAPGAVCYHYNPETLTEVFASSRWYARGRRLPWSWRNLLIRTPPMPLLRSLKRAIRHRLPAFMLFLLVGDTGAFIGLLEKRFGLAGRGR